MGIIFVPPEESRRLALTGWARRAGIERGGKNRVTQVIVEKGESFEAALKRFNKRVQADRILSEARRRRFFEKPSVERKRKAAAKRRKSRRQSRKVLNE